MAGSETRISCSGVREAWIQTAVCKYDGRDVCDIALSKPLKRDEIWTQACPNVQLEFVVDNQIVAGLANIVVHCTQKHYEPVVQRARYRIMNLIASTFDYKAGFLQPVDWRPREFNGAADLVADHVLYKHADVHNINIEAIGTRLKDYSAVQFFCDGGFDGERFGSMAFVIVGYQNAKGTWQRHFLGWQGVLVNGARSAFQCEIGALDIATEAAVQLASRMPRKVSWQHGGINRAHLQR